MTDDALPTDCDEDLREAHRAILELKREVEELREDFARLERKIECAGDNDRLAIPLMQA